MAQELEKIKRLCTELSDSERLDLIKFLQDYNSTIQRRTELKEQIRKSLGPMSSFSCPYCGK